MKQAKDAKWWFKKHGSKHPGLTEIKLADSFNKRVLSYRLSW